MKLNRDILILLHNGHLVFGTQYTNCYTLFIELHNDDTKDFIDIYHYIDKALLYFVTHTNTSSC